MVGVCPENEGAVINDVLRVAAPAKEAGGGDCQGAGVDAGRSGVGVDARERESAGAVFG